MSAGADARHGEGARCGLGQAKLVQVRPLRDDARRFGMALGHAHDVDRRPLAGRAPLRRADHDGGAAIALQAAIQQPQRIGDHPRGLVVLDVMGAVMHGIAVEDRVPARRHGDLRRVAGWWCRTAPCAGGPLARSAAPGRRRRPAPRTRRPGGFEASVHPRANPAAGVPRCAPAAAAHACTARRATAITAICSAATRRRRPCGGSPRTAGPACRDWRRNPRPRRRARSA